MAGLRSELAGCRITLSMSKIKVKISETKYHSFYNTLGKTKKVARGTPNKEQNVANKEQNLGKRTQMESFWGVVFHENTLSKSKFRSKGADLFWAPPILELNCAYIKV